MLALFCIVAKTQNKPVVRQFSHTNFGEFNHVFYVFGCNLATSLFVRMLNY